MFDTLYLWCAFNQVMPLYNLKVVLIGSLKQTCLTSSSPAITWSAVWRAMTTSLTSDSSCSSVTTAGIPCMCSKFNTCTLINGWQKANTEMWNVRASNPLALHHSNHLLTHSPPFMIDWKHLPWLITLICMLTYLCFYMSATRSPIADRHGDRRQIYNNNFNYIYGHQTCWWVKAGANMKVENSCVWCPCAHMKVENSCVWCHGAHMKVENSCVWCPWVWFFCPK